MEEIMDKRKKDRLVKGIFLNGFIVIGCIVYIIIYILPQYDAMGKTLAKISDTRADISSLKSNGPSASSFTELLTRLGKKKELSDIVFSDATKLNNVLKKPATIKTDYLSWITSENIKIGDIDKEIQENDAILGNIIPVFMNSSNTIPDPDIENQITLSSFISYIEKEILQKYTLSSYAPLGISNITFPDKKDTPINIGNFKITLDFKGRNSNILAFIDAIQSS